MSALSLLSEFVAYNTVSSRSIMGFASQLASLAEDLGFAVEFHPCPDNAQKTNLICRAGPQKTGGLILSGHMDVVPTEDQPWQSDPFVLTERDGKAYGRGSADMKGFIACTMDALTHIDLKKLTEQLVLIWTYDEEVGCQGSHQLAHTLTHIKDEFPSEALIGEPTDFRIFRMHAGHVSVKITTIGQAAHSSKPHLGSSAIMAMNDVINTVIQFSREFPTLNLNIGKITGGQAVNIIPDHCEIILGYRPLPGDDAALIFKHLSERIQNTHAQIKMIDAVPALNTPDNQPLQHLLSPFASDPKPAAASFATDGGNLAKLGIHSLIFGPGSIDVAHQANEYIELKALIQGTHIVEQIVRSRCFSML